MIIIITQISFLTLSWIAALANVLDPRSSINEKPTSILASILFSGIADFRVIRNTPFKFYIINLTLWMKMQTNVALGAI